MWLILVRRVSFDLSSCVSVGCAAQNIDGSMFDDKHRTVNIAGRMDLDIGGL